MAGEYLFCFIYNLVLCFSMLCLRGLEKQVTKIESLLKKKVRMIPAMLLLCHPINILDNCANVLLVYFYDLMCFRKLGGFKIM